MEFKQFPHTTPNLKQAVQTGFNQRPPSIPPRFFYDQRGSRLFKQITDQPEYYLTRTEEGLLRQHGESILEQAGKPHSLIELGAGSARKTEILLEPFLDQTNRPEYWLNDINPAMVRQTGQRLESRFPNLKLVGLAGTYRDVLQPMTKAPNPRLMIFLGSSLGNYEPPEARELLKAIAETLEQSDRLLLGLDQAKHQEILESAYNDSRGITAQFNKNLLIRINRELGASIDPERFRHRAPYIPEKNRVEMRLVSQFGQWLQIPVLPKPYRLPAGDYLHTENSYKYSPEFFRSLIEPAGLTVDAFWSDPKDYFKLVLLKHSGIST